MMARDVTKNCISCGYILDGLPGGRCPECGREFDLADAASFAINRPHGSIEISGGFSLLVIALMLGAYFGTLSAEFIPYNEYYQGCSANGATIRLAAIVLALLLLSCGLVGWGLRRFRFGIKFRVAALLAVMIVLAEGLIRMRLF